MAQNKVKLGTTRWVALMIQLGKFVGGGSGGVVADTNYLYPARWGWIKNNNMNYMISSNSVQFTSK